MVDGTRRRPVGAPFQRPVHGRRRPQGLHQDHDDALPDRRRPGRRPALPQGDEGLRLAGVLLYGTQKKVYGLDTGLFSDAYALKGLQAGLGNQVLGKMQGVQVGLANGADHGAGLQLGVLNRAKSMKGLQLGVLNFNDEGFLPVFPLFNFTP